ncbi:hypothetical protein OKW76_16085 [Sphingomonas sp. S1-29]|uniref:hypothetical protein n=1 Tax=Sphingomonas sp. S1-29 TaxID=2991074 RepID=UPI002240ADE9|nr:hypothetical protein [Sphingomonas sp. S1-29]UZK69498.1 hypothetical protein OKW76_16085 [Sphingomonas sp. S1-29]
MQIVVKAVFLVLAAAMLFLALTPGQLGMIVESGEHRHLLAFSLLPLVGSLAWPRLSLRLQFVFYALLGGAIELTQAWMAVGRAGEWDDWAIDCLATAAALLLVGIFRGRVFPRPPAAPESVPAE